MADLGRVAMTSSLPKRDPWPLFGSTRQLDEQMSNQMAGRNIRRASHNPGAAAHFAGSVPALHSWPVRVSPLMDHRTRILTQEHKQEECQLT